jgi:cytochrome c biogenesis protein CcmG/thiol:disulfide interchange protein DsbE
MRYRISLLVASAALACTACAPAVPPKAGPAAAAESLPATRIESLDGSPTDLPSALGGRPALVSLWATWCESCVAEVEALDRLDALAQKQSAVVLAVAVGEPRSTVAAFARDRAVHYRVLVDPDFALADALGQRSIPATLVVDGGGRIVFRGGAIDSAALAALRDAAKGNL